MNNMMRGGVKPPSRRKSAGWFSAFYYRGIGNFKHAATLYYYRHQMGRKIAVAGGCFAGGCFAVVGICAAVAVGMNRDLFVTMSSSSSAASTPQGKINANPIQNLAPEKTAAIDYSLMSLTMYGNDAIVPPGQFDDPNCKRVVLDSAAAANPLDSLPEEATPAASPSQAVSEPPDFSTQGLAAYRAAPESARHLTGIMPGGVALICLSNNPEPVRFADPVPYNQPDADPKHDWSWEPRKRLQSVLNTLAAFFPRG